MGSCCILSQRDQRNTSIFAETDLWRFVITSVSNVVKQLNVFPRVSTDETDASFRKTDGLDVTLTQLQKFTNYSLQVLAYTRKGEGVRSNPIYVRTLEDGNKRLPLGVKIFIVDSSIKIKKHVSACPWQTQKSKVKYLIFITKLKKMYQKM